MITKLDYKGKLVTTTTEIIDVATEFYETLFTSEQTDERLYDAFLSGLTPLSSVSRNLLENDITKAEILNALKAMGNNKSPGSDGLKQRILFSLL